MKEENKKKLVLIELNEINFDYVEKYCNKNPNEFKNFSSLLKKYRKITTSSEKEHALLEPWIQWVSAHTNLDFKDHNIFRLGDIVNNNHKQIFETIEQKGYSVGCVSPMNTKNNLKNPKYFIPDPWTDTNSSNDFWSKKVHQLLKQTVNDNAKSKITLKSVLIIILAIFRFARFRNYLSYLFLAFGSLKNPWRKALFLDQLVNDIHIGLMKSNKPDFSTVFLNAGAHIQHHYFHNSPFTSSEISNPDWYIESNKDPIFEMLKTYDQIIGDYLNNSGYEVILCTGLSQKPYEKVKFYYRLKEHKNFLSKLGIKFKEIFPRMTRDFLITFENDKDLEIALDILSSSFCLDDNKKVFGEIERRESPSSLFVTLDYPNEIKKGSKFKLGGKLADPIDLYSDVVFVAIKNGEHNEYGTLFINEENKNIPNENFHIKSLFQVINSYF
tara:strand:- start:1317 stop:2639 length:1323 start_codon:yes stop_codon:yes gene_type:complete